MSGLKTCLAAVALVAWCGASASGQAIVPGGWAPQVGYQSFGGVGPGGGYGVAGIGGMVTTFGPGGNAFGVAGAPFGTGPAFAPAGGGGPITMYSPNFTNLAPSPTPQARAGFDPLTGAIRQATRRPKRR